MDAEKDVIFGCQLESQEVVENSVDVNLQVAFSILRLLRKKERRIPESRRNIYEHECSVDQAKGRSQHQNM